MGRCGNWAIAQAKFEAIYTVDYALATKSRAFN
jgi:hypothetical protein